MRLVTAIIQPFKLDDVRSALTALGVQGMTVTEVRGFGRQRGHTEIYRGAEYAINFVPKIRIDVVVATEQTSKVVAAIRDTARIWRGGRRQDLCFAHRASCSHSHWRNRRSGCLNRHRHLFGLTEEADNGIVDIRAAKNRIFRDCSVGGRATLSFCSVTSRSRKTPRRQPAAARFSRSARPTPATPRGCSPLLRSS